MRLKRGEEAPLCLVAFLLIWNSANGLLSPKGVNFEGKMGAFFFFFISQLVLFIISMKISSGALC